jgi:hypothetical protein
MIDLLRLQSVTWLETLLSEQSVYATLNQAFSADPEVKDGFQLLLKPTYKKISSNPLTLYGSLGANAMPLVTKMQIYPEHSKTIIKIHSSLLHGLIQTRLILFFFIALCLIVIISMVLLQLNPLVIGVAPLTFWLFGRVVLSDESKHTAKTIQAILDDA